MGHNGTSASLSKVFAMVSASLLLLLIIEQLPLVVSLQRTQGNKPGHIVGVPREKQHLYDSNEPDLSKWHCLDREDIVLDLSQINDGVCDCPDGSDEPGTTACEEDIFQSVANQSSKVSKYFYCDNENFIPRYIRKSEVTDGVCDCCDCSDELLSDYKLFNVGPNCSQLKKQFDAMISTELRKYREGKKVLNGLEKTYGIQEDSNACDSSIDEDKQSVSNEIKLLSNRLEKDRVKLDKARREYFDQLEYQDPILYRFEKLNRLSLASEIVNSFVIVSMVSKCYGSIFRILNKLSEVYTPSLNDKVVNDNIKKFKKIKRRAEKAKITADSTIDDEQSENLFSYFTEEVPQLFLKRESEHSLRYVLGKSNFVQALIEGKINYTNDILEYIKEYSAMMDDISKNYNVNFQDAGVKSAVDSYNDYLDEYGECIESGPIHPSENLLKLLNEITTFVNENVPKILPLETTEPGQDTNDDHMAPFGGLRNKLWGILSKLNLLSFRGDLVSLEKQFRLYEKQVKNLDLELQMKRAKKEILDDIQNEGDSAIAGNLTELLERMGSQSYCVEDLLDNYLYTMCFQHPMIEGSIYQSENKIGGKKVLIGHFKTLGLNAELNVMKYVEHLKLTYSERSDLTSQLAGLQGDDDKSQHYIFGNLNELNNGLVLEYENGDQCWNGPRRSATVFVRCSNTFKILSVHEVTKCNYIFDVTGPLGCNKTFEYEPPKFNLGE